MFLRFQCLEHFCWISFFVCNLAIERGITYSSFFASSFHICFSAFLVLNFVEIASFNADETVFSKKLIFLKINLGF